MKRPTRLLVIDDNPAEILLLEEVLLDIGWNAEVEGVTSVMKAIVRMRELAVDADPPDLILLDYHLGPDTADTFLARANLPGARALPPIAVFSSGPLAPGRKAACHEMGVLKVFVKPANYDGTRALVDRLRALLLGNGAISSGGSWIGEDTSTHLAS